MLAIDLPTDDRRAILAGLAFFAALAALPRLAGLAAFARPALPAHELPAVARADAGIVTLGDERCAVERDDIEPLVPLVRIVGAADVRRDRIAAGARETLPIGMRNAAAGIAHSLIETAVMRHDLALVEDHAGLELPHKRELARWTFRATRASSPGFTLFALLALFATRASGAVTARDAALTFFPARADRAGEPRFAARALLALLAFLPDFAI